MGDRSIKTTKKMFSRGRSRTKLHLTLKLLEKETWDCAAAPSSSSHVSDGAESLRSGDQSPRWMAFNKPGCPSVCLSRAPSCHLCPHTSTCHVAYPEMTSTAPAEHMGIRRQVHGHKCQRLQLQSCPAHLPASFWRNLACHSLACRYHAESQINVLQNQRWA